MAEKELPADILFSNILPRLPPKSQSRFKCVSKQWHSFLTSPAFRKMHLRHVINNDHQINNQKLLFLPNNKPWEFRTIDCETPEHGFTASRPLPFKLKRFQEILIVSSLHGMVCVGLSKPDNWSELSDLILWNPSTGDYKTLSKPGSQSDCYKKYYGHQFGLYYSSSKDDYRLVCVNSYHNNVCIYSLKYDSWRKVDDDQSSNGVSYEPMLEYSVPSVLFNGKLYFLLYKVNPDPRSYALMTFDTQTEKLSRDIATPPFGGRCMGLMVIRDCIHMGVAIRNCIAGKHDAIELWRMDGDGDGDWKKVETCFLKEDLCYGYKPLHLMRNGNWVMYSSSKEGICVLDTKKQTTDFMCSICIAFNPQGKYIENIVSPNQYLK